tara:strand:- start:758 stop:895 length:138 start_codon:yes stop_codon:yes gene_type:complete
MNKEQLQKLASEQEWSITYHSSKLTEAQGLMILYQNELAKLPADE